LFPYLGFHQKLKLRIFFQKFNFLLLTRIYTQLTRKNNIKPKTVPITLKLQELFDKVGVKDSPFILGLLDEGFAENTMRTSLIKYAPTSMKNCWK